MPEKMSKPHKAPLGIIPSSHDFKPSQCTARSLIGLFSYKSHLLVELVDSRSAKSASLRRLSLIAGVYIIPEYNKQIQMLNQTLILLHQLSDSDPISSQRSL